MASHSDFKYSLQLRAEQRKVETIRADQSRLRLQEECFKDSATLNHFCNINLPRRLAKR